MFARGKDDDGKEAARHFSRRRLLKLAAGTAAGLAMPGTGLVTTQGPPRPVLPIPPRLEGPVSPNDLDHVAGGECQGRLNLPNRCGAVR